MDFHYQGIWRMDWGFGNPNKTAALIALLMLGVWVLPLIRRWLFWVALPVFTGLGVCLMHTMSRGGLVAALFGFGALLAHLPRPWAKKHVIALSISVSIMLVGAVALQTTARFAQSYQDSSISNRARIWRCVPRMIVDAPQGWGLGKSGNAYLNWYQPTTESERYRTLVNSHFTWLVEIGWPLRVLYVFGWAAVFVLCYGGLGRPGYGIALGVWLTFFAASAFSSVAEVPWIWVVPALSLIGVLIARLSQNVWPGRLAWTLGFLGGLVVLSAIYLLGKVGPESQFSISPKGSICVGEPDPKLVVVVSPMAAPGTVSENYPRNYRDFCKETATVPSLNLARHLNEVPNLSGKKLAVVGPLPSEEWRQLAERAKECEELVLVSPDVVPAELKLPEGTLAKTKVIFGEFSTRSAASSWRNVAKFQQAEGVGDFFQRWPEIILNAFK